MAPIMPVSARRCPTDACGSLSNATALYQLVAAEGMANTKVVVIGPDLPGVFVPSQPQQQQRRPFLPFGGLFRF